MPLRLCTVAFAGCLAVTQAFAAPFCLEIPGGAKECIYYDGAACARDANRATGATCAPNTREVQLQPRSDGNYCMVTGQGASVCGYADPTSCADAALRVHGACVKAPTFGRQQIPNIYAPNAGR